MIFIRNSAAFPVIVINMLNKVKAFWDQNQSSCNDECERNLLYCSTSIDEVDPHVYIVGKVQTSHFAASLVSFNILFVNIVDGHHEKE